MSSRLCGVCSADTLWSGITCGGRCRRSFHISCVGLSSEAYRVWKNDTPLVWFCSDCLPHTEYESLPPEVLEQIFLRLKKRSQLLQMRQVCRHWRDVVDGTPSLIDQFTVEIDRKRHSVEDCEPMNLFPARKVVINDYYPRLAAEKHWWSRLIDLSFNGCEMTTSTVLGVIQSAPNLRRIEIAKPQIRDEQESTLDINLELTRLEELCLKDVSSEFLSRFLDACKRSKFPQLKIIRFHGVVQDVISMIQAALDTVEHVEVYSSTDVLQELCKIPRLRLKRIHLGTTKSDQFLTAYAGWLDFLQKQKDSLEGLEMPYPICSTNEVLHLIGQMCPNLKRLSAYLPENEPLLPSSLKGLTKLEYLDLGHANTDYTETCTFNKWEDLFLIIERLSDSLRSLSVSGSSKTKLEETYLMSKQFRKLTKLDFYVDGLPLDQMKHFLKLCPMLKDVDLFLYDAVDDDVASILLEHAKNLRSLSLTGSCELDHFLSAHMARLLKKKNIKLYTDTL